MNFKYWDDCVDPEDLQLLWTDRAVRKEWTDANERMGHKIHLSRDPDGQPYLTQTEMRVSGRLNVLNNTSLNKILQSSCWIYTYRTYIHFIVQLFGLWMTTHFILIFG